MAASEITSGACGPIHAEDFVLDFLMHHPVLKDRAIDHYFVAGRHSAENLRDLLRAHAPVPSPGILDFAAGVSTYFARLGMSI